MYICTMYAIKCRFCCEAAYSKHYSIYNISILLKLDYCLFVCLFTKGSYDKDREKKHTYVYNLDRDLLPTVIAKKCADSEFRIYTFLI